MGPSCAKRLTEKTFLNDGERTPLLEQGHRILDPKEQVVVDVAEMKDKSILRNTGLQNKRIYCSP